MFKDFIDLIALLNKHKAKYLVIGGYAVGFHAQARATKDLDILILPAPKNAAAVFKALQEFGAPLRTKADPADTDRFAARRRLSAKDFEDEDSWFMMGTPPVAVDILAKIPGVVFNAAWKNRKTVTLDEQHGVTAQVLSRDSHSGSPAFRRPSSYLAMSSGRRNGSRCRCLRSETRRVGSMWRRRTIALWA